MTLDPWREKPRENRRRDADLLAYRDSDANWSFPDPANAASDITPKPK